MVFLAAAVLLLQDGIDQGKQDLRSREKRRFVPPRAADVRYLAMGYQGLVADAYWLGAIQHYSDSVDRDEVPVDLYAMGDFITEMDPKFAIAYYFTGLNLAMMGGDPDQVVAILEKGRKNRPDVWRIPFYLGFYYYFVLQDFENAATNVEAACELRKSWAFCLLATRIRAQAGDPDLGIKLLVEMMNQTSDENKKRLFIRRIRELTVRKQLARLNELAGQYRDKTGKSPSSLNDLVTAGLTGSIPPHPLEDHRYVWDPEKDEVVSDPHVDTNVFDPWKNRRSKARDKLKVEGIE